MTTTGAFIRFNVCRIVIENGFHKLSPRISIYEISIYRIMYKKFDIKLENIDYDRLKGPFFEGYGENFKQYKIQDLEYLQELIADKIEFTIEPEWVTCCEIKESGAYPHVDHNTVSFNYYINANNYTTIFWKTMDDYQGQAQEQTVSETGSTRLNEVKVYEFSKLIPVANFTANSNQAYLLDVKKIHSATPRNSDKSIRTIIRWAWDQYDFETIKHSINIKNDIDKTIEL